MPDLVRPADLTRDLAARDLTDPTEGPHAMQLLVDLAVSSLSLAWGCDVRPARGPRIVPLADNYDHLRYPAEAVTRDARHTRYVDAGHVLRSHASAMIPPALRALAATSGPPGDVLLVCPGITYRRDSIDRLHTGTPHQLDLWRVSRRSLHDDDLDEMLELLLRSLLPGHVWRCERRTHPYTLNGRQVDVRDGDAWVEVLECGLARPDVLAAAGLRSWSGLALGMGLDRLLMLRKGIPDIRLLRSTDERVAAQMIDLARYRPVSDLPMIRRDVSVAVARDDDAEVLGDRVREALGTDAELIETVGVLSETPCEAVPPAARQRLGMTAEQKNVLVRVVIRPVTRTLTDAEANCVRDRIHRAIHQGQPDG